MKNAYYGSVVAIVISFLFTACSGSGNPNLIDPTSSSVPSMAVTPTETGRPTLTPASTVASTPTLSPSPASTPTITPAPSPTPFAGMGGVVTYCASAPTGGQIGEGGHSTSGYYFVDLTSMEYRLLERYTLSSWDQGPLNNKNKLLSELKMKGVSDDFLARIGFPEDFDANFPTVVQVSADGDKILFYNIQRLSPGVFSYYFSLVTTQNPSKKKLDTSNKELISDTVRYSQPNDQLIMSLIDKDKVDLYLVDMSTGQIKNLTGNVDDPIYGGGRWSPDGSKIAFFTDAGIWVINGQSEPVFAIPGGLYPEWNLDSRTLVYRKDSGYNISDWDGSNEVRLSLVDTGPPAYRVQWVPDGKRLIYWSFYKDNPAWFVANLEDGTSAPIFTDLPNEADRYIDSMNAFTWSPDQHWFLGWSMSESYELSQDQYFVCNIDNLECFRLDNHPADDGMRCGGVFWPAANHP